MKVVRYKARNGYYEHAMEFEVDEVFEADTADGTIKVRCVESTVSCLNCALCRKALHDDYEDLFCDWACACTPDWRHDGRHTTFVEAE